MMIAYRACALQFACYPINGAADQASARAMIMDAIARAAALVPGTKVMGGDDMKLVVLPEYVFTNFSMGKSPAQWRDWAAFHPDGPEYEALAKIAQDNGVYLVTNAYELDDNFPDTYFQACVIFDDTGNVALRYRRLNSIYTPTPHDYWDRYLELYGLDGVFPVAKTPIGNLCAVASEEMQYPELIRTLALRGAEVLCHPCADPLNLAHNPKNVMKQARAIENLMYVVSANLSAHKPFPMGEHTCDGGSRVIDFQGRVLAEAGQGESMAALADINISALRRYRNRPEINNFLTRQRMDLYHDTYAQDIWPKNSLADRAPTRDHMAGVQQDVLARLIATGIIEAEDS
ncbi:MAG: nitrilase-related carbon-nitrogen hydrolase [Rhodospirillaceae bacterium]